MSHIIQSNGFARRQRAVRVAGESDDFFHPCLVCVVGKYKPNLVEVFNVCIVLVFHFNVIEYRLADWLDGWVTESTKKNVIRSWYMSPAFPCKLFAQCSHTPSNVNHSENIGFTLSIRHICFLLGERAFCHIQWVLSPSCHTFYITTINSSFHTTLW